MIDHDILLRFGLALAAVLGLFGLLALIARLRMGTSALGGIGRRRVSIVETTALDGRTRLVLVRRDEREHLLAIHPAGVTLIETVPPAPP